MAAYSRLASRSQAKFQTTKSSPLSTPCAAAPAQSTVSTCRSLRFSPRSCADVSLAGLGFSLLREERQRRASHHVGLPDGTDTILKDLWFGTHHTVSLKRCRPHSSKNLRLEVEVLQKSAPTQQLQVWRSCKACRNRWNLSLLNNGQLLPEKFRVFILGGEFFNHWGHHRVSKRCVDGWPTSRLFCVQTHLMWHMVWRRGLVVTESVVTRRLGRVEGITVNLETLTFPGENLLDREELEGGEVWVQSLRQFSLDHFFIFFKPLCYTSRRSHGVLQRWLV